MGKRHVYHDIAAATSNARVAQSEDAAIGRFDEFLWPEMHLIEDFVRQPLPLSNSIVTMEDAGYRRVRRVAPLYVWVEERQDPLDSLRLVGVVCALDELDVFPAHPTSIAPYAAEPLGGGDDPTSA